MRATAAVIVTLVVLLAAGGSELLWRLDHPVAEPGAWSQSGSQVAEVRFLPEGSAVPYGSGVFVRSKWAVLYGLQSELAFAGYCGNITTQWPSAQQLSIQCELLEGEPFMPRAVVNGTSVQVVVLRKQAANPFIERTGPGKPGPAAHVGR
jgi:hypothetical protein